MSCPDLDSLLLSGAPDSQIASHRATCRECGSAESDLAEVSRLVAGLVPPAWSDDLRASLYSIPARTVSCEASSALMGVWIEGEATARDLERLEFHLSRCEACSEAARTLSGAAELVAPAPAPWLAGRIAAVRPKRRARSRSPFAWLLDPKAAIGLAYAAAIGVMLLGWNPADFARKAGSGLRTAAQTQAATAGSSAADRLGALQERVVRGLQVVKGRFGGYGRAALSNALNLVMRPEKERPPSRPRNGEEKGDSGKSEYESLELARLADLRGLRAPRVGT